MDSKIRFGRRQVEPLFDLVAWERIEEEFGSIDDAFEQLSENAQPAVRRKATLKMATILCNNRLDAEGKAMDVTMKEMTRGVPPKYLQNVRLQVISAINKGLRSDYDPADEEPVDVVLEEIAKKQNPDG